ncbi:MAG: SH3 domain-containing protein [Candidatus Riflebacteria bacterium]
MQKRIFLLLLTIFLFGSLIYAGENPFSGKEVSISQEAYTPNIDPELPPVVEGKSEVGTVDVESTLNIRTSPWGDITGSLKGGDKVTIIGQSGDWYKITVGGKTAYVHTAYIKRKGEKAKPFPTQGWVNAPLGLNVRRVPHGDIIGKLSDQKAVEILGVAGDFYKIKWGDNNEAFVAKKYIDTKMPSAPAENSNPDNFIGYVTASALNVRTSPWGAIETTIPNGIAVKVTGKVDDWYRIDFNGKVRYVHADYISKERGGSSAPPATTTPSTPGNLQQRIAQEARKLVGSHSFRGREVDYGNLACAQVVTTALKNAGALSKVHLNVRSTVSDLKSKGWKEVSVPPYQEGDVITWKTYDYTGDGVKDPDTHVGIIVKEGNSFMAMNNSSRLRMPRLTTPTAIGPITRVLRKVA